jgi:hypothetical protein
MYFAGTSGQAPAWLRVDAQPLDCNVKFYPADQEKGTLARMAWNTEKCNI